MIDRVRRYAAIQKVEEAEDGTLRVFGIASTDEEDSDGEVITADAMRAALPDYLKWGAVREMHQPKAAGTALEAQVREDGKTMIGVHVVDPVACEKVRTRVYKGFSVGGKALARDPSNRKRITKFGWIETSLVDRPSNPSAEILVVKADIPTSDDPEVPVSDEVTPATAAPTEKVEEQPLTEEEKAKRAAEEEAKQKAAAAELAAEQETAEKAARATDVAKSAWSLKMLVDAMAMICDVARTAEADAFWQRADSALPEQMKTWIRSGTEVLKAMTEAEATAMLASLGGMSEVKEAVAKMAAAQDRVEKAAFLEVTDKLARAETEKAALIAERDGARKELQELQQLTTDAIAKMQARGVLRVVGRGEDAAVDVQKSADELTKVSGDSPQAVVEHIAKLHRLARETGVSGAPAVAPDRGR